jgi:hypothetical protein
MLIDLSHNAEDGMVTSKGLPAPIVCDSLAAWIGIGWPEGAVLAGFGITD